MTTKTTPTRYLTVEREALDIVLDQLNAIEPDGFHITEVKPDLHHLPILRVVHKATGTEIKVDEHPDVYKLYRNHSSKRYYVRLIAYVASPESWRSVREQPYAISTKGSDEKGYTHTINAKAILKTITEANAKKVAHEAYKAAKKATKEGAESLVKQAQALLPAESSPYAGHKLANGVVVHLVADDFGSVHVKYSLPIKTHAGNQEQLAEIINTLGKLTF